MPGTDLPPYPRSKIGLPTQVRPVIARPRLFDKLDASSGVTLVIAPAGSGKTSLLASWVHECLGARTSAQPAACFIWYSLDPDDREPARMVDGIAAATELALPGCGAEARARLAAGSGIFGGLATLLVKLEQLPAVTLVLDNCHHIDSALAAESVIEHLVRNRPPTMRLILSSRGIPLVPALSAVAGGQLQAVGRDDLEFSVDEAICLLEQHGLPGDLAPQLVRSAHGWAMGLLLFAHAHASNISFLQQPTDALAEYLMTQVADLLPDPTRAFLLESSLLGTYDAGAADAILSRDDSRRQIDVLIRQGLFLDAYPGPSGPTVRYHDLFAEALSRAMAQQDPMLCAAIHRRACEFHQSDPHLALMHSAEVGDATFHAAQLEQFIIILYRLGHNESIIHYAEVLPETKRQLLTQRVLSMAYYRRGDDRAALQTAGAALQQAEQAGDTVAAFSATVLRANPLIRQGRVTEALDLCLRETDRAHALGIPEAEGWLCEVAVRCYLLSGRVIEGKAMAERTRAIHRQVGEPDASIAIAWFDHTVAPHLIEIGDCRAAEQLLATSLAIALEHDQHALAAFDMATRSELLLQRGEPEAAVVAAEAARERAAEQGNEIALYTALRSLALAQAQLGRSDEATASLERYMEVVANWPATVQVDASLAAARVALMAGDGKQASEDLETASALGPTERVRGLLSLLQGTLALLNGQDREADRLLAAAATHCKRYGLAPQEVLAIVLRTRALAGLGRETLAVKYLSEAGVIAKDKEWVKGIARECEPARQALQSAVSHYRLQGKGRELVETLLLSGSRRIWLVPAAMAPDRAIDQEVASTSMGPGRYSPFADGAIECDGQWRVLTSLAGEKARELLAFAIWKGQPVRREEVLEALWDGQADDATLAALRKASYQIRRFLGSQAWQRAGETYTLTMPIEDEYRSVLAIAAGLENVQEPAGEIAVLASRGVSLYGGPFLQWCESAWVESPRSLAHTAAIALVETLVDARQRLGQPLAALEAAERGLSIEPYRESIRCKHIDLLLALGRRDEAVESCRRHIRLVRDEALGKPSPEFERCVATLRAAR